MFSRSFTIVRLDFTAQFIKGFWHGYEDSCIDYSILFFFLFATLLRCSTESRTVSQTFRWGYWSVRKQQPRYSSSWNKWWTEKKFLSITTPSWVSLLHSVLKANRGKCRSCHRPVFICDTCGHPWSPDENEFLQHIDHGLWFFRDSRLNPKMVW